MKVGDKVRVTTMDSGAYNGQEGIITANREGTYCFMVNGVWFTPDELKLIGPGPMIEYAVMSQVDTDDPEVFQDGFKDRDKVWAALNKAENSLYDTQREGITIRNAAQAKAAAEEFKRIERTRFYIARRTVTEWEEE